MCKIERKSARACPFLHRADRAAVYALRRRKLIEHLAAAQCGKIGDSRDKVGLYITEQLGSGIIGLCKPLLPALRHLFK